MATIRECFLVDPSVYFDLDIVYSFKLRDIQNLLNRHRRCYVVDNCEFTDKCAYTSDIFMKLKAAMLKLSSMYTPPNVPKLIVDS